MPRVPRTAPHATSHPAPAAAAAVTVDAAAAGVDTMRRFARVFTSRLGLLNDAPYGHGLTLPEARLVYELAQQPTGSAVGVSALADRLSLDLGYVSRLVSRLVARQLVQRSVSRADRRARALALTASGRRIYDRMDATSRAQVGALLASLDTVAQRRVVDAARVMQTALTTPAHAQASGHAAVASGRGGATLRSHCPGDLGWMLERHGDLYHTEYGWDASFEGLVASVVAAFATQHDPGREHCWIAEVDGQRVGAVMLVRHPERDGVAKLRLLFVDAAARGLGVGRLLVQQCTTFARVAGYHTITLWTNDVLQAARALYVAEGYRLVERTPHRSFGVELVGETWELALA